MSEQQESNWGRHDPLTQLHATLARVEERLAHVIERLELHVTDEHADFRGTLADIKEVRASLIDLERKLDAIHTSARVTRWLISGAAALVTWLIAVKAGLAGIWK